jgi:hypothetical protein
MPRSAALPLTRASLKDSDVQRFWRKVPGDRTPDACWPWLAARNAGGYGLIKIGPRSMLAPRVSYAIAHGSVDPALVIDHLCRNTCCVNPAHLEAVEHKVNIGRGIARMAGVTRCKRGHPFTAPNTRVVTGKNGKPERVCRECTRIHAAAERKRLKQDPERLARRMAKQAEAANRPEAIERRNARARAKLASETPEERAARLAYHREYNRTYKRKPA